MTGGKGMAAVLALALTGCLGQGAELQIRPTPAPPSLAAKPVPERIAEARGQLALGNVAMALELFRKASREDPASTDALAGMARCYEMMERFDLSRRYLEQALALAPADGELLAALAGSLQGQGLTAEAQAIRAELALRAGAGVPTAAATVALPVAVPAPPTTTVTVALPLASPTAGPRLERMSLGEVALVTTAAPRWQRDLAAVTRTRSAPASGNEVRLAKVRLLNAARVQGLAARTRTLLRAKGWEGISIGDSPRLRQQSLVLYSARDEAEARRLAAQLGVAVARDARPGVVTVLLGSDAAAKADRGG